MVHSVKPPPSVAALPVCGLAPTSRTLVLPAAKPAPPKPSTVFKSVGTLASSLLVFQHVFKGSVGEALLGGAGLTRQVELWLMCHTQGWLLGREEDRKSHPCPPAN